MYSRIVILEKPKVEGYKYTYSEKFYILETMFTFTTDS